jgi:enamine deaminase RidA (YjgF/YER057c/UK114 family)
MKDTDQKNRVDGKGSMNPIIAAVSGAIVGAGAVVAGVVALNDEKNREKAKHVLHDVKDHSVEAFNNVKKDVKDAFHHVEKDVKKTVHAK